MLDACRRGLEWHARQRRCVDPTTAKRMSRRPTVDRSRERVVYACPVEIVDRGRTLPTGHALRDAPDFGMRRLELFALALGLE